MYVVRSLTGRPMPTNPYPANASSWGDGTPRLEEEHNIFSLSVLLSCTLFPGGGDPKQGVHSWCVCQGGRLLRHRVPAKCGQLYQEALRLNQGNSTFASTAVVLLLKACFVRCYYERSALLTYTATKTIGHALLLS